jgi:hypothetical protein
MPEYYDDDDDFDFDAAVLQRQKDQSARVEDYAFKREERRWEKQQHDAKKLEKGIAKDLREAFRDPESREKIARDLLTTFRNPTDVGRALGGTSIDNQGRVIGYELEFDQGFKDMDEIVRRAWERE